MKNKLLVYGTICISLFLLLSFFIGKDLVSLIDRGSMEFIQRVIPRSADFYLSFLSLLGSFELLTGILAIILVLMRRIQGIAAMAIFMVSHAIEYMGKYFLYHPGPPSEYFRYKIDFIFPSSFIIKASSYPSGHSLRTMFLTIFIFFILHRTRKLSAFPKTFLYILFFVVVFLELISRISLGEHWLSDVIGGVLLGSGGGLISLGLLKKQFKRAS